MADQHSKSQRSFNMSRVRSRGNASTELRVVSLFRQHGIAGWRRHLPLPGRPDFTFKKLKVVIFIDGCFWHGCPKCRWIPATNTSYWTTKIAGNRKKDRLTNRILQALGWTVLRVWEHTLKKRPDSVVRKVQQALRENASEMTKCR